MLVPNTNTRARCTGDDEAPLRPGTRPVGAAQLLTTYLLTYPYFVSMCRCLSPPHSQPRALRHTSLSVMRDKKSHKVCLSRRLNASTSLGAHHPCTPPTTSGSSGRARPVTIASQVGLSCLSPLSPSSAVAHRGEPREDARPRQLLRDMGAFAATPWRNDGGPSTC